MHPCHTFKWIEFVVLSLAKSGVSQNTLLSEWGTLIHVENHENR
jgi:hypothetical protein